MAKRARLPDELAELVRARGSCERCGTTENLQCAHIISRRYSQTRCRLDNAANFVCGKL
jgi:hypothetical protein